MLESEFGEQIKDALEGKGALTFKVHGHAMQKAGWPDLQVYSVRWTGHIELKVNDVTSNIQRIVIHDLLQRGTPALVLRWVGGCVQAETKDAEALGYIPARTWSSKLQRGEALMGLLELATVELRDRGALRAWIPQWQLDEEGRVIGQKGFERSTKPSVGRDTTHRFNGKGLGPTPPAR